MTFYGEYTTITDVRSTLVGNTDTDDDTLYLDLIKSISSDIDSISGRSFAPRVETLAYNTPKGSYLEFGNRDVLELTTLTNGDGTVIASSYYLLDEPNDYPKWRVKLKPSSGLVWTLDSDGEAGQAISIAAITGYHADYANAWKRIDTLGAALSDTTGTSVTTTGSALVHGGDLLKIDSEMLYASSVATTTTTAVRGVNGSTAATHLNGAVIYKWVNPSIEMLCRYAVVAQHKLKNNPAGETISVGGYQFSTPKDIKRYLEVGLGKLGVRRIT